MHDDLYKKSEYIYKGNLISLRLDPLVNLNKTHEIVEHPPAAAILPLYDQNTLILIKQYRRAADQVILEIPAGIIENKEKPIDCAQRELQEEIGYFAKSIEPIGSFYLSPGFCNEYLHLFLAKDLIESKKNCDDDEEIEILFISIEEAIKMIKNKKIYDSKTIAAILYYQCLR